MWRIIRFCNDSPAALDSRVQGDKRERPIWKKYLFDCQFSHIPPKGGNHLAQVGRLAGRQPSLDARKCKKPVQLSLNGLLNLKYPFSGIFNAPASWYKSAHHYYNKLSETVVKIADIKMHKRRSKDTYPVPRKHADKLALYLRAKEGKATFAQIEEKFAWREDKVRRLLQDNHGRLKQIRHGVSLIGNEIGPRGAVPLYSDVSRVLENSWAKSKGLQAAVALDTALAGRARTGVWSRPDCVLISYPARRTDLNQPPHLSTFEIERQSGFSVQSVYEAHSHGWGADYSWVVFVRSQTSDVRCPKPDWERVLWSAKTCGIGLISCTNPGNHSTWREHVPAKRRQERRRSRFVEQAIPKDLRGIVDLGLEDLRRFSSRRLEN